ncbi:hypothetical protein HG530_013724 [Fusarium avenaceum]|nr:hypothetical protein HG530_013724 [Fusarium avenaceum]
MIILNLQLPIREGEANRLDNLLKFCQTWCRLMLTVQETIHNKGSVIGCVAEVTTIGVVSCPFVVILPQTVVGPLPDETTLQTRIIAESLLVVLEPAWTVTHGVTVFAEDDGLLELAVHHTFLLGVLDQCLDGRIHVTVHVCCLCLLITLVVNQSRRIGFSSVLEHSPVVITIKGLISKTPHNDTRVVLITIEDSLDAVEVCSLPSRVIGGELSGLSKSELLSLTVIHRLGDVEGSGNGIVEAVTFQISFRHNPETILVTKIEDSGVVRLMGAAKSVYVVLLHDKQVSLGKLQRHRAAEKWVVLVTVDSPEADAFSVDHHEAILKLDLSETEPLLNLVEYSLGVFGLERQLCHVEIWCLCCPLLGALDGSTDGDLLRLRVH